MSVLAAPTSKLDVESLARSPEGRAGFSTSIRDWSYRLRDDFGMSRSGRRSIDPDLSGGRAQMLNARVPAALFDQLTSESKRRGMSRSGAVREALDTWLSTPVESIEEPAPA